MMNGVSPGLRYPVKRQDRRFNPALLYGAAVALIVVAYYFWVRASFPQPTHTQTLETLEQHLSRLKQMKSELGSDGTCATPGGNWQNTCVQGAVIEGPCYVAGLDRPQCLVRAQCRNVEELIKQTAIQFDAGQIPHLNNINGVLCSLGDETKCGRTNHYSLCDVERSVKTLGQMPSPPPPPAQPWTDMDDDEDEEFDEPRKQKKAKRRRDDEYDDEEEWDTAPLRRDDFDRDRDRDRRGRDEYDEDRRPSRRDEYDDRRGRGGRGDWNDDERRDYDDRRREYDRDDDRSDRRYRDDRRRDDDDRRYRGRDEYDNRRRDDDVDRRRRDDDDDRRYGFRGGERRW